MESSDVRRAIAAALEVAASFDLPATDAMVLHNSNKLALRLMPCDVLARVSHVGLDDAQLEVDRAQRLAAAGCPVGVVEPRVDPLVYVRGSFAVTLWTYYEPMAAQLPAVDYGEALARLHAGMRSVEMASPRYTDRIADAQEIATSPELSPDLAAVDRALLSGRLAMLRQAIEDHGAEEQLLHGEPHPGNVLATTSGPLFVDFETSCHGPVEFDLAYVPEAVCEHYPTMNQDLLDDCRQLVIAMVAAWRWRIDDEFPDRTRWRPELLRLLRTGPPWPTLDAMTGHLGDL